MNKKELNRLLKKKYEKFSKPDSEDLAYILEMQEEIVNNEMYEKAAKRQLELGCWYLESIFKQIKSVRNFYKTLEYKGKWKDRTYKNGKYKVGNLWCDASFYFNQGFQFVIESDKIHPRLLKRLQSNRICSNGDIFDMDIIRAFTKNFKIDAEGEFEKFKYSKLFSCIASKTTLHFCGELMWITMDFSVYYLPYWGKDRI